MKRGKTNRRNFIKNSSLALLCTPVLGKGVFHPDQDPSEPEEILKIKNYKTLGRTGFKVSDIASGSPRSEAVLRALLKSGVNYIDTGEQYGNGNNERLIGKVLKEFDRKKIQVKDITPTAIVIKNVPRKQNPILKNMEKQQRKN